MIFFFVLHYAYTVYMYNKYKLINNLKKKITRLKRVEIIDMLNHDVTQ
jgi:hypothetical protein